jgi:hypothetical protein
MWWILAGLVGLAAGASSGESHGRAEAQKEFEEQRRRANRLRLRAAPEPRLLGNGGRQQAQVEVVDTETGQAFKLADLLERPLPGVENVEDFTYQFTEVAKMAEARHTALKATRLMHEEQALAAERADLARLKLKVERVELKVKLRELQRRQTTPTPSRETRRPETAEERKRRQAAELRAQFENNKEILHASVIDPETAAELEGALQREFMEKLEALLGINVQ